MYLSERRSCLRPARMSRQEQFLGILDHLDDRCRVHKEGIHFCQNVLRRKDLDWEPVFRNNLCRPIHGVDLVVTVGGDGTLLQASHLLDNSIPILGVNSDPTQPEEVDRLSDEFDATRSTGYLCAATKENFEQILDKVLDGKSSPSELGRISAKLNGKPLPTLALNDVLIADPCPATVSRFSFRIEHHGQNSCMVNCRSSGLRVCTASGSTAAMLSAGGFPMPISSKELQFMVREPISPRAADVPLMHGRIGSDRVIKLSRFCKKYGILEDHCCRCNQAKLGSKIQADNFSPVFRGFLPPDYRDSVIARDTNCSLPIFLFQMSLSFPTA
ncbi:putative NADH kinase [Platanthera zijinensis]|uniref:NADH kinase n=1 Tax=Platanthera zijinensis TaxID=2320716 RepID=A0AAP0BJC2_9ASPA